MSLSIFEKKINNTKKPSMNDVSLTDTRTNNITIIHNINQ